VAEERRLNQAVEGSAIVLPDEGQLVGADKWVGHSRQPALLDEAGVDGRHPLRILGHPRRDFDAGDPILRAGVEVEEVDGMPTAGEVVIDLGRMDEARAAPPR
jgi:hypothetical protein